MHDELRFFLLKAFCVHLVQTHDRRFTAFVSAMPVHQEYRNNPPHSHFCFLLFLFLLFFSTFLFFPLFHTNHSLPFVLFCATPFSSVLIPTLPLSFFFFLYIKKNGSVRGRCCECHNDLPHSQYSRSELRKDGGRACKECLRLPGYCIDGDPGPAEGSLDDDAIAREEDEDEHDGGSLDSFETFSARVRINNSYNYVDVDEDDAAAAAGGGAEWNKHLPLSPESSQRNIVILRRPKNQWQRSKPDDDDDDDDCYTTPGGYRRSRATGGAGAGAGTNKRKRESNRGNSDWNHYKRLNKWRRCDSIVFIYIYI